MKVENRSRLLAKQVPQFRYSDESVCNYAFDQPRIRMKPGCLSLQATAVGGGLAVVCENGVVEQSVVKRQLLTGLVLLGC